MTELINILTELKNSVEYEANDIILIYLFKMDSLSIGSLNIKNYQNLYNFLISKNYTLLIERMIIYNYNNKNLEFNISTRQKNYYKEKIKYFIINNDKNLLTIVNNKKTINHQKFPIIDKYTNTETVEKHIFILANEIKLIFVNSQSDISSYKKIYFEITNTNNIDSIINRISSSNFYNSLMHKVSQIELC
ncbi:hypothetical protein Hokovirus_3_80 [Hokovirus HKV1]|uniref:Uncharacterized protein n=1 Tax=Hokovirus HKV1 TaxID=1977638 RepID=A0A1V0SGG4_9VIRU|nr:hypothetical protein Hokovirus_3_80 [Hokovirus HKV1]